MANFYNFLIATTLAEKEFDAQGVPNSDRAKQLGLFAALLGPSDGGGLGASVLPAVLVQQTARREAADAAAEKQKEAAAEVVEYPDVRHGTPTEGKSKLQGLGFNVTVEGAGSAIVEQVPAPTQGLKLPRATPVTLKLGNP